jgi:hypothetical protein
MDEILAGERVPVPFAGDGAGVAELTWAQQAIWRSIHANNGWTLNITRVDALPDGLTVADVAGLVAVLVSRHPTLRTRFRTATDGRLTQEVAGAGVFTVEVIDVPDGDDPRKIADGVSWKSLLTPFDHAGDWPMRVSLIRHRGVPRFAAWTFCHLNIDAAGLTLLLKDLRALHSGQHDAPHPPLDPLALAHRETTPAARRQNDAAMAHWERHLRMMPGRTPRATATDGGHRGARYWHVKAHSPAAHLGIEAIGARTRTDPARVLMAVYAVALARVTGLNPVVTDMVVSNRMRPRFAGIVGAVSQHGVFGIDVAGITVDEAVGRARASTLSAAKYAYYDPASLDALLTRIGAETDPDGAKLSIAHTVNDRRRHTRRADDTGPAAATADPDTLRAAAARFALTWVSPLELFRGRLDIAVDNRPGTVDLSVNVDTRYLSPDTLEAFLREFQKIAVDAAHDPQCPTRVPQEENR